MKIKIFIQKYKRELIIFLLSLILQMVFFSGLLIYFERPNGLVQMTGDANAYRVLTENLKNHRSFSLFQTEPYRPDSFRSPGYPFFLLPIYTIINNWLYVLIVQSILYAFIPVLIYLIGKNIHEKSAFIASLIFAVEPTRIFLATSLLTDSLFTLLLLLFVFYFFRLLDNFSKKDALLGGFFLGLATLVRPVSMFLPFLVFFLIFIGYFNKDFKKIIIPSLVFLMVFMAIIFPWSLRNKNLFDSWQLSSVGSYNLVYYNLPEFMRFRDGEIKDERLDDLYEMNKNLPPLEQLSLSRTKIHSSVGGEILKEDFIGYFKFHLLKTTPFFLTDGIREITRTMGINNTSQLNLSSMIVKGEVSDVYSYLVHNKTNTLFLIIGSGFWFIVNFFAFISLLLIYYYKRQKFKVIASLYLLIVYFAFLTGPVSNARYRLPVSGLMIFLSVLSLFILINYVKRKPFTDN